MVKRSRLLRSSSHGSSTSVLEGFMLLDPAAGLGEKPSTAPPPQPVPKKAVVLRDPDAELQSVRPVQKTEDRSEQRRRQGIFSVGLPCGGGVRNTVGFGKFFHSCFMCNKNLGLRSNLFMYGFMRAFCSPECRKLQIRVDNKRKSAHQANEASQINN